MSLFIKFVSGFAAPKSHNHDDVYSKTGHTHTTTQVDGLDAALSGKSDVSHKHAIDDVDGLQHTLDTKVVNTTSINGKPLTSDITLTPQDVKADPEGSATNAVSTAHQYTDVIAAKKSDVGHTHVASDITGGEFTTTRLPIVPLTKGGTEADTPKAAQFNIIGILNDESNSLQDTTPAVFRYIEPDQTKGSLYIRPLSAVWTYIKSKCDAIYQAKGSYAAASHNHDSVYAKTSHTHSYLPLSGGTVTNQIKRTASNSTQWVLGRDRALIRNTASGSEQYEPILSAKTASGSWDIGTYTENRLHFSYITDANYNNKNNTQTANIVFGADGTITAPKFSGTIAWGNVSGKPSSFTPASHNHSAANITSGTLAVARGGTGVTTNNAIGLKAYPVGAVYISYSSTSPAALFGGSWTAITGRFPYFNAGTGTGGSNSHTLSVNELASHYHDIKTYVYRSGSKYGWHNNNAGNSTDYAKVDVTTAVGGNKAHNNMPAYQTFYAWRRTG